MNPDRRRHVPLSAQSRRNSSLRTSRVPVISIRLLSASITVGTANEIKQLFLSYQVAGVSFHQTQATRRQTSLFAEAEMADHTDHKLTRHTLRRTETGSVDA